MVLINSKKIKKQKKKNINQIFFFFFFFFLLGIYISWPCREYILQVRLKAVKEETMFQLAYRSCFVLI
jgi:hypothetical protein